MFFYIRVEWRDRWLRVAADCMVQVNILKEMPTIKKGKNIGKYVIIRPSAIRPNTYTN
jgi:hypothetical protein